MADGATKAAAAKAASEGRAARRLERSRGLLGRGERVRLGGLRGAAPAWALSRVMDGQWRPSLVVCPSPERAEAFFDDLQAFLGLDGEAGQYLAPDRKRLFYLPAWEQRPSDNRSPSVEFIAQRTEALFALLRRPEEVTVVTSAYALLQKCAPAEELASRYEYLLVGADAPFEELPDRLVSLGYRRGPRVEDRGEFAIKGGILDIFPPGYAHGLRLEFFGDTLESVRPFDPLTQRSVAGKGEHERLEEVLLLPMREVFAEGDPLRRALAELSKEQQEGTAGFRFVTQLKEDLEAGRHAAGIEYLLSHFYEKPPALLDLLPKDAPVAVLEPEATTRQLEETWQRLETGYERRAEDELPAGDPRTLFVPWQVADDSLRGRARLSLEEIESEGSADADEERWAGWHTLTERTVRTQSILDAARVGAAAGREEGPLAPLVDRIHKWQAAGMRVVIASHTASQQERLTEVLRPYDLDVARSDRPAGEIGRLTGPEAGEVREAEPVHLVRGSLSGGFEADDARLVLLTEEEFAGTRRKRTRTQAPKLEGILTSLTDLAPGDFVVHAEHGVGRFLGLENLAVGGAEGDFLKLEYAGGDKLFVPATRIRQIARYKGAEGYEPPLDKMGGVRWKNTRKKVREAVYKLAAELLQLYATRQARPGFAFPPPGEEYRAFEASFEFDETADQQKAIADVLHDLQEPRPMDRLVCGDVGFGKTEVAMRAAYLAVLAGRQVAMLVPTTVLAEQHLVTFRRRFEQHAVRIEALSRLQSATEQKAVLAEAREGKIDILIGTHRLLQNDVSFKDLGLIVVDEEQRFGVKHKERLKRFKQTVDSLTLSATPIPRTLQMSMVGIRDLSIIATPPHDRLSIRTIVGRRSDRTIKEAVQAELDRGGQVFFVHNRVQTIREEAERLRELVPGVRLGVAHGQMDGRELEDVMNAFLRGETQVLLCTSIIENGLDISNANTVIVDRADHFGLSQLYQIRGRVGRGSRRAYCYLLLPTHGKVTADAEKRLQVLQEHSDLGAGFRIATYDLELRGGGNVLGEDQSGHVAAVGLELYTELLDQAVHELKGEAWHEEIDPEVNLGVPALLPDAYVPDLGEKLNYYKRLSAVRDEPALEEAVDELVDCYGTPPEEVRNLIEAMRARLAAKELNIVSVDLRGRDLTLTFHQDLSRGVEIDRDKLLGLVTKEPDRYKLRPDLRLLVRLSEEEGRKPGPAVRSILQGLI